MLVPLLLAPALLGLASLVLRFRRHDPQGRRQIAWVGFALAWAVLASFVAPPPVNVVATLAVPVAIGIAVVRHRLFGIDVVLNRSLVGTALLACSALVYVAVVGWLGGLAGTPDSVFVGPSRSPPDWPEAGGQRRLPKCASAPSTSRAAAPVHDLAL